MNTENLKFGTSGVRGRVIDFTSRNCRNYAISFCELLKRQYPQTRVIHMARDLRESSPMIQFEFAKAFEKEKFKVISLGEIPTPALALQALSQNAASVMVTGSHIPADRNGVKFYTPEGEITKEHEIEIRQVFEELNSRTDQEKSSTQNDDQVIFPEENKNQVAAEINYENRYVNFFGQDFLKGVRVLFYQHSTVGRNLLPRILKSLGAQVIESGKSEKFIPVDTENVSHIAELEELMFNNDADLLASADGDADRPLLIHRRHGQIVGDVLGMITAKYLEIPYLAVPVSCTSLIDESKWFDKVVRTRIGSPFVISAMENLKKQFSCVAGFEANGGFILGSDLKSLRALPTRDALLPILVYLKQQFSGWIAENEKLVFSKSNLSGLLKDFSMDRAHRILNDVGAEPATLLEFSSVLRRHFPKLKEINSVDGIKLMSLNGASVHLRPSGNAPEFRVYVEASSKDYANEILRDTLIFCDSYR